MKFLLCLFLFSGLSSEGAVILKTTDRQALLHLEGLRTHPGAYFEVMDLYGNSRGLLQIRKLSKNKRRAIGILKSGRMAKRWALEPMSRRIAIRYMSRQSSRRQALLKKRRSLRRPASSGRVRQKPPRRKERRPARYEYEQSDEYAINDEDYFSESSDYGSESSGGNDQHFTNGDSSPRRNYYGDDSYSTPRFSKNLAKSRDLIVGVSGSAGLGFMKLKDRDLAVSASGLGWGGQLFLDGSVNDLFRFNGRVGYQQFNVGSEDPCDVEEIAECFLNVRYFVGGVGLKVILKENGKMRIWGGAQGHVLFPWSYVNEINLTPDSFGLHGNMGISMGFDIKLNQSVVLPLSFETHLVMPPTKTVTMGSAGIHVGVGWSL